MRKYLAIIAAGLALVASPAAADWTGKNAAGATITFSNPVDCTIGTCIPIAALVTAAGATLYGTAGSSNTAVISVQGIASGTALPISGTVTATPTGTQAVSAASASYASGAFASGSFASGALASGSVASGAFASGSIAAGAMVDFLTTRGTVAAGTVAANSQLVGGIYNSTPITMTNGQGAAMQFDANGYLKVNTAAGAAAGGTSSNFGSAFPTPGTAVGFTDGTNMVAGRVGAVANVAAATNFLNSLGICQYLATPPTLTDTRFNQVQCDVNGNTKVTVANTNANGQATMANSSPVTIASNQTANALWGHGVTGAAVPANATYMGFNSGGNLVGPATATPLPVRQSDGTNLAALDPCQSATVNSTPINISTATTTRIATEASSVRVYICHLSIVTALANNVALIEGTGASCAGGTPAGMAGGTTAASGWNFSANGGISLGMGGYSINQTLNTNYSVCLVTSAATQLSGVMKWVAR